MNIIIDIGHAAGTGARGNGLEEHAECTAIAAYLADLCRKAGHTVWSLDFPHESNARDLALTVEQANRLPADIGISLHCDCSDNATAHGGHVCYLSTKGERAARAVARHLCALLPGRAAGVVKRENLMVLKKTRAPWILCECGFISHAGDAAIIHGKPLDIARAIFKGVQEYGGA